MTPFALDHPYVRDYLQRLDTATALLPLDEREEVREGIRGHLIEALADAKSDADVRNTLTTLGDPYAIVGLPPAPPPPPSGRGVIEVLAVILLLVGAFIVPVVGWVAGVVLLWTSKAWTAGQKLLGTLVVPGGLAGSMLAFLLPLRFGPSECTLTPIRVGEQTFESAVTVCSTGSPSPWLTVPLVVLLLAAPIVTAVYLLRAANRPAGAPRGA